jgi:hypothetical protein
LSWLAVVLALLCRPTPGTEVLAPVVVVVAVAVVILVGHPVGGTLARQQPGLSCPADCSGYLTG